MAVRNVRKPKKPVKSTRSTRSTSKTPQIIQEQASTKINEESVTPAGIQEPPSDTETRAGAHPPPTTESDKQVIITIPIAGRETRKPPIVQDTSDFREAQSPHKPDHGRSYLASANSNVKVNGNRDGDDHAEGKTDDDGDNDGNDNGDGKYGDEEEDESEVEGDDDRDGMEDDDLKVTLSEEESDAETYNVEELSENLRWKLNQVEEHVRSVKVSHQDVKECYNRVKAAFKAESLELSPVKFLTQDARKFIRKRYRWNWSETIPQRFRKSQWKCEESALVAHFGDTIFKSKRILLGLHKLSSLCSQDDAVEEVREAQASRIASGSKFKDLRPKDIWAVVKKYQIIKEAALKQAKRAREQGSEETGSGSQPMPKRPRHSVKKPVNDPNFSVLSPGEPDVERGRRGDTEVPDRSEVEIFSDEIANLNASPMLPVTPKTIYASTLSPLDDVSSQQHGSEVGEENFMIPNAASSFFPNSNDFEPTSSKDSEPQLSDQPPSALLVKPDTDTCTADSDGNSEKRKDSSGAVHSVVSADKHHLPMDLDGAGTSASLDGNLTEQKDQSVALPSLPSGDKPHLPLDMDSSIDAAAGLGNNLTKQKDPSVTIRSLLSTQQHHLPMGLDGSADPDVIITHDSVVKIEKGILSEDIALLPSTDMKGALSSLQPRQWVSASAIEMVMGVLHDPVSKFRILSEGVVNTNDPKASKENPALRKQGKNSFIIPLHFGTAHSGHWTLGVIDFENGILRHYNTIKTDNYSTRAEEALKAVVIRVEECQIPMDDWKFVEPNDCPAQQNGFDCGVYCIAMAAHILAEQPMPKDVDEWYCDIWRSIACAAISNEPRIASNIDFYDSELNNVLEAQDKVEKTVMIIESLRDRLRAVDAALQETIKILNAFTTKSSLHLESLQAELKTTEQILGNCGISFGGGDDPTSLDEQARLVLLQFNTWKLQKAQALNGVKTQTEIARSQQQHQQAALDTAKAHMTCLQAALGKVNKLYRDICEKAKQKLREECDLQEKENQNNRQMRADLEKQMKALDEEFRKSSDLISHNRRWEKVWDQKIAML